MMLPQTRINLLPYRERKVKDLQVHFFTISGIVVSVAIVMILVVDLFLQTFVVVQEQRVSVLKAKIVAEDKEIAEIAKLKKDIQALIGKKSVIESLQDDKNTPLVFFNALAKATPAGMYIDKLSQSESSISISAVADGNARVSLFIKNLEDNKEAFSEVRLGRTDQTKAGNLSIVKFNLTLKSPLFAKK